MKLFTTLAFSILIVNSAFSFENNKTIPDKYHGLFYSSVSKSKDILLQKKLIVEGGTIWQIYYTIQKSDTLYAFGKNSEKIQTINDNYQYEWSINDEQKRFKIFLNDDKIIVNDKVLSKKETLLKFNPELPSNELNTQSFRVTVIKHPSLPFNTINASYSPMYQNDYKVNRTSDSLFTFGGIIYSDQELNISPLAKESFGNNTREDTLYYPRFKLYVSPGKHSQLYIDSNLNIHFLGHLADFNTQYNQLPKDTDYFYKLEEYLNKKDLIECIEDKLSELQKVYDTHLTNQQYSNEFKRYIFTDILIAKANKISVLHNQNYNLQYFLNKKESKTHIPEYQLEDLLNEVIPDHKAIDIEIYMKKIDKYPFVNYLRYHNPGISFNSETFFLNFINENKEILSDEENEIFEKSLTFSKNDTFDFSSLMVDGELLRKKFKYFFDSLSTENVQSEEELINKIINFRKHLTQNHNITKEENDAFDNLVKFYRLLLISKNISEDIKKYPKGISQSQAINLYHQINQDDNPNDLSFFLINCKLYNIGLLKKSYPNLEFSLARDYISSKEIDFFQSDLNANKYHPLIFIQDFEDTFSPSLKDNKGTLSKLEIIINSSLDPNLKKYCYHFFQNYFSNRQNLKYP